MATFRSTFTQRYCYRAKIQTSNFSQRAPKQKMKTKNRKKFHRADEYSEFVRDRSTVVYQIECETMRCEWGILFCHRLLREKTTTKNMFVVLN